MAEEHRPPPISAEELLHRYAAGERGFSNMDLLGANLGGICLRDAYLDGTYLDGAKLTRADLRGSNLRRSTLRDTDLRNSNLHLADLVGTDLRRADLRGSNLRSVDLSIALLNRARLDKARLRRALLIKADLTAANLLGADLRDTDVGRVRFDDTILQGANFGGARLWGTLFLNVDLSPLCEAVPPLRHVAPSTVDFRSVVRSLRSPNLAAFLQKTGMPAVLVEDLIKSARRLEGSNLHSTFISYGKPDEAFARKLYEALHRNGVTTFFFPEHAEPGEKLHDLMRKGVNSHDRLILVCSKGSLDRNGVLNEIEQALAREAREGGEARLIPIRLDDFVFSDWVPTKFGMKQEICDRVVADFRDADVDPAKFEAGLRHLIAALTK